MSNLEDKIAKADEAIKQLQNKRKRLLSQKKDEERRIRTRRLIERGAILESCFVSPENYSNDDLKRILNVALRSPDAREILLSIARKETNRE